MTPHSFVADLPKNRFKKLEDDLLAQGFSMEKIPYALFLAKKEGVSVTLYLSGKLVVQGKKSDDFIRYYLEPEILETFNYSLPELSLDLTPKIGIDESGKGDIFGPLCIAGVYADEKGIKRLVELGIKDSKKLQDSQIEKLAPLIKGEFSYDIIRISPEKYNDLYNTFRNLNHLLGWGHAKTIENLMQKTGCTNILIDQFAHESVVSNALKKRSLTPTLTQRHKGENDPVVAAASILARDAFVSDLHRLSSEWNITLPKGAAGQVKTALSLFIKKHSEENLPKVAKMHFKTVHEV